MQYPTRPKSFWGANGGHASALALPVLAALLGLMLSGCVTSAKYRLARTGGPPPQVLDLKASDSGPLQLSLATVIVYKGPGSWKKEARWDEYIVQVVNRGEGLVTVESAELIDLQQVARAPGTDPWVLEDQSRTNWNKYQKAGVAVAVGAGGALYGTALLEATTAPWLMGGAGAAPALAVMGIIPVALVDVTVVAARNHYNKLAVEKEFERRRLFLPHVLAPGDAVQGSLFFPMTPGPRQLIVNGRSGAQPIVAVLDLGPLAMLHLAAAK
jgi:hypothetical protein